MADDSYLIRREMISQYLNPGKDLNTVCGYPNTISASDYARMYAREGVGARVVDIFPEECWAVDPWIYETEDAEETEFEKALNTLVDEKSIFEMLFIADKISGVGAFGVLLLGTNDGGTLNTPLESATELTYIRAIGQDCVTVSREDVDVTSPRYGLPVEYQLSFLSSNGVGSKSTKSVHYSRVIHIADNRQSSLVLGIPRMQKVYNRLLDIRKLLSGSAEMFWAGAFPGFSMETAPDIDAGDVDTSAIKEQMDDYVAGLKRYLATSNVTIKSLAPQVSDPTSHIMAQIKALCISIGVPYRIFLGSEEARLAASEDAKAWYKKIAKRQNSYVTHSIIRPFIVRLMEIGVLPHVDSFTVTWPDLYSPSKEEKAKVGKERTEALAKYVQGSVDEVCPPMEFLTIVLGYTNKEAQAIVDASNIYAKESIETI